MKLTFLGPQISENCAAYDTRKNLDAKAGPHFRHCNWADHIVEKHCKMTRRTIYPLIKLVDTEEEGELFQSRLEFCSQAIQNTYSFKFF